MAVKRLNMVDAITATTETISRSRTAIVRRGVVSVLADVNGIVKVALGGGTVDAVPLSTGVLAVGNQVAVLADTDAYWIVGVIGASTAPVPPITSTRWTLESDFGTPATGYTRQNTDGAAIVLAPFLTLCQIEFYWTNTATVTVPANGILSVTAAVVPAGMRTGYQRNLVTNDGGIALYWQVINDGTVRWCGATGGASIAPGGRYVSLIWFR